MEPKDVTDADVAFGGRVRDLMPAYKDIPDEFKRGASPWCQWQSDWFFKGLSALPTARSGIDGKRAMRHLATIQRSFEPAHEHKEAAVAYLASQWFESPDSKVAV